jgi:hypothetical protein
MEVNNFPRILTVVQQLDNYKIKKENEIKGEKNEDLKEFITEKASDKSFTLLEH